MEISPIELKPKQSGGKGGLWGKIAGGAMALGGAIAAPFTAGSSLAAVPAVLGAMGAAAPAVGNAIDPAKESGGRGVSTLESAAKADPQVQARQVLDTREAVRKSAEFDDQKKSELDSIFAATLDSLKGRM